MLRDINNKIPYNAVGIQILWPHQNLTFCSLIPRCILVWRLVVLLDATWERYVYPFESNSYFGHKLLYGAQNFALIRTTEWIQPRALSYKQAVLDIEHLLYLNDGNDVCSHIWIMQEIWYDLLLRYIHTQVCIQSYQRFTSFQQLCQVYNRYSNKKWMIFNYVVFVRPKYIVSHAMGCSFIDTCTELTLSFKDKQRRIDTLIGLSDDKQYWRGLICVCVTN